MKRITHSFVALFAIALIPLALHIALNRYDGAITLHFALWAPMAVLALDALLFYVAFGYGSATVMERVGLGLALPLIITMITWAFMRDGVEERMNAAQAGAAVTQAPAPSPEPSSAQQPAIATDSANQTTPDIVGNDRDEHGCIGSAGYVWCAKEQACVRPWELTAAKGLPNLESAFQAYCSP